MGLVLFTIIHIKWGMQMKESLKSNKFFLTALILTIVIGGLTFGNLSAHMSKLEDAGYIQIIKEFIGKKPHTMLRITEKGRQAFDEYRTIMKDFFNEI